MLTEPKERNMLKSKTANYGASTETVKNVDTYGISSFLFKSIGAALCGAAIPAVVFYFLF